MINIKKILVPTDFSATAARAVNHAALLAEAFEAKLTIVNVLDAATVMRYWLPAASGEMPAGFPLAQHEVYKLAEDNALRQLQELAGSDYACRAPGCERVVLKGETAAETVARYAKSNDFDLIAAGTHGRTGISEWFLGSVTERILRIAPCPVLTVGPMSQPHPAQEVFDHILFAFDLSDASKHALRYACAFAGRYGARLELLHVVEYRNFPASYSVRGSEIFRQVTDLERRILSEMENEVKETCGGALPAGVDFSVEEGKAFERIIGFAKAKAVKLIVIGNTGLGGTHGHRLGSTAENVVPRARCPVLVVNSKIHEFLAG